MAAQRLINSPPPCDVTMYDFLMDLIHVEWKNLSIGEVDSTGKLANSKMPRVMSILNRAFRKTIQDLENQDRFVRINVVQGLTRYPLKPEYSVNNPEKDTRYHQFILDTLDDPFPDEVFRIRRVLDHCNNPLNINTDRDPNSVYLYNDYTIDFQPCHKGVFLVQYSVRHVPINVSTMDELQDILVPLPEWAHEIVGAYAAYLAGRGSTEEKGVSNQYYQQYEMLIGDWNTKLPARYDTVLNHKLTDRDFP